MMPDFKSIELVEVEIKIEHRRPECEYCGSKNALWCNFYYEDLCPDENIYDLDEAKRLADEMD